jgi:hypothetical protein
VEKCGSAGQDTDDNIIWHMCSACWINNATDNTVRTCNTSSFLGKAGYGHVSEYYYFTNIFFHVYFNNP